MKTTSPAGDSGGGQSGRVAHGSSSLAPEAKRLKLSSFVDTIDDGTFILLPVQDYSGRLTRFKKIYGEVPVDQIPTREQLSALQARLLEGDTPYTDFSIWTPGQRKRLREEKVRKWTIVDGAPTQVTSVTTPPLAQWRESFVIFKHAMVMLDQGTFADFERYKLAIEGLADTFKDYWSVIYQADELLRSSHIAVYKEGGDQMSWGNCFVKAADDASFWRSHVDHAIMRLHFASQAAPAKKADEKQKSGKDGCKSHHDLPRGRNQCPKAAASKAAASRDVVHAGLPASSVSRDCTDEAPVGHDFNQQLWLNSCNRSCTIPDSASGLRRAYDSTKYLPEGRIRMQELRRELQQIIARNIDTVEDALGKDGEFHGFPESMIEEARDAIVRVGHGSPSAKLQTNPNTPLRPGLWKLVGEIAGDWDSSLADWLVDGAPIGISTEITAGGWFPQTAEEAEVADESSRELALLIRSLCLEEFGGNLDLVLDSRSRCAIRAT
ncbi:hypothetical protein FOZ62_001457 [Perkinsus olseni]|uniref:Uncharacterized protein n=1 Tax=Perkinsus olseni TaxID=32597 RepID=A0A7J6RA74_PEROL|nr:hypothetical protein FOZ62_001457 [Perkinsus olseni]